MLGIRSRWEIISVLWGPPGRAGADDGTGNRDVEGPTTLPRSSPGSPAEAVGRLVEQLKRHPARPTGTPPIRVYLMDLNSGEVTLIADQPAPA